MAQRTARVHDTETTPEYERSLFVARCLAALSILSEEAYENSLQVVDDVKVTCTALITSRKGIYPGCLLRSRNQLRCDLPEVILLRGFRVVGSLA